MRQENAKRMAEVGWRLAFVRLKLKTLLFKHYPKLKTLLVKHYPKS